MTTVRTMAAVLFGTAALMASGGQDLPGKMTGTWALNRELSPGLGTAPGRGRQGGYQPAALYTIAAAAPQRGGGGGRGGSGGGAFDQTDLTPEQRGARAAMAQLQQIGERLTIKAATDSVTFVDARGEHTYAVADKASTIDVGGSPIKAKSKWDKQTLKQEFTSAEAKLTETWSVDASDHLVLISKFESMSLNLGPGADRPSAMVTPDRRFVFDRR